MSGKQKSYFLRKDDKNYFFKAAVIFFLSAMIYILSDNVNNTNLYINQNFPTVAALILIFGTFYYIFLGLFEIYSYLDESDQNQN